jgi:peptidylprolyl isomerase
VSYTGALWKDGSIFDASAKQESKSFTFQVGKGAVISGWDKAVKGQKVGSRLLLVVPPAEGYGDKGNGAISGTDTLVFVVDILAAY